jgi:phospholipid-binding lipoprotein MlaA
MRPIRCRTRCAWLLAIALLAAPAASADDTAAPALEPAETAEAATPEAAADAAPDPLFDEDASDEDYATELGAWVPDPLEPLNRQFFRFNDGVDQWVLLPVTEAYQFVIPKPVRLCVRRFFRNLKSPVYFVNNLLQLRFVDAAQTLAGFALNSTAGFMGLFDPASNVGWKQHPADFGQTLGFYGVKSGPYLVVPLLGPSTVRDGTGDLVDRAFDPLTYVFGMGNLLWIGGSSGFVTREANAKALAALRESSVDYYAAMRSAYTQNRESRIAELRSRFACMREPQETAAAK